MAIIPRELRIAIDQGYGLFSHLPLQMYFPPGTLLVTSAPPDESAVWQYYLWTFGAMTPGGFSADVYFKHWQEGVQKHDDPMVHSLMDFEYSIWVNSTRANPHYIEIHNTTGVMQIVDTQFWMVVFPNRSKYIDWYCDLILMGLRNDIGEYLLRIMKTSKEDFERRLEYRSKMCFNSRKLMEKR